MKSRISMGIVFVMILTLFYPGSMVFAAEETPVKIEIATNPKTTEYCVGDSFQKRGLSVLVTYESGNEKLINSGFSASADFSAAGEQNVVVSYSEAGTTVQAQVPVVVYEKPVIKTENVSVDRGKSFKVPVTIEKNCGLMGIEIDLQYDENCFVPVAVEVADLLKTGESAGSLDNNIGTTANGTVSIIWAGVDAISENGKLFEVEFFCKENSLLDEQTIAITANKDNTYTEKYSAITCVGADSTVTVDMSAEQQVKLKRLNNLTVSMKNWEEGAAASEPVISGNDGNGKETITYASVKDNIYTSDKPSAVGDYYVKVAVERTEEYESGIATATFSITKKQNDSKPNTPGSDNSKPNTPGTDKPSSDTPSSDTPSSDKPSSDKPGQTGNGAVETKVLVLNTPAIKSVKNVKGKKVTVKIAKKIANATGYEIQYSLRKNMKSAKKVEMAGSSLKKQVTKLKKGKKYYFRARTYAVVDGQKYYSGWSGTKAVKIKK